LVKIYLWVYGFFNNYDNPQMTYRKYSQNISIGSFCYLPHARK
jgi:hypothetical protein